MNPNTYRIPLETAQKILATFGITSPTRAYERWVRDDGFDLKDFDEVLFESPFIFAVDGRAWLREELETMIASLHRLGVHIAMELDDDGEFGHVVGGDGVRAAVQYLPNEDPNFDDVVRALQSVVPTNIEFRRSPHNDASDTGLYAVLPNDEWAHLQSLAADVISYYFVRLN